MHKQISSFQNPLIKQVVQLQEKSKYRKKYGQFIIEGKREIELAIKGNYRVVTLFINPEIVSSDQLAIISKAASEIIEISDTIFKKLTYRSTTEGVLAIVKAKDKALNDLKFKNKNPLVLIAEAPEKPGNIGALLRTADAANLDAVIIANPKTDFYNPNIIRSSVGCVFTIPIATGTTSEIISFLKENNIAIYSSSLLAAKPYYECNFKLGSAIIVGTEATGLSKEWLNVSDYNIIIPMQGEIDSMNVSVAAGIIIFEAKRQRGFN